MTTTQRTRRHRSRQRNAILDAAVRLLAERGPSAFTVRNVATLADCSTSGVYTWFGSKSGLVEAIYVGGFDAMNDNIREASGPDMNVSDMALAYRNWAIENRTLYLVMFGRVISDFEPSAPALELSTESFSFVMACLARYLEGRLGVLPSLDDLEAMTLQLWAAQHGFIMLELAGLAPMIVGGEEKYREGIAQLLGGLEALAVSA